MELQDKTTFIEVASFDLGDLSQIDQLNFISDEDFLKLDLEVLVANVDNCTGTSPVSEKQLNMEVLDANVDNCKNEVTGTSRYDAAPLSIKIK